MGWLQCVARRIKRHLPLPTYLHITAGHSYKWYVPGLKELSYAGMNKLCYQHTFLGPQVLTSRNQGPCLAYWSLRLPRTKRTQSHTDMIGHPHPLPPTGNRMCYRFPGSGPTTLTDQHPMSVSGRTFFCVGFHTLEGRVHHRHSATLCN